MENYSTAGSGNLSNIESGIATLRRLSSVVKQAFIDKNYLIHLLNETSEQGRQALAANYRTATGPVKEIRKAVSEILVKQDVPFSQVENIINSAIEENPGSFSTMYKNWYNILYPLVLQDRRSEMKIAFEMIINGLNELLGRPIFLKSTYFDFSGERETGSTRSWIALYNHTHKKQTTALQLFINIENGAVFYSVYDRPNDYHFGETIIVEGQAFDAKPMLALFSSKLKDIENNVLLDNANPVSLNGANLFKVSMGPDDVDNDGYDFFLTENLIVVHKDTKAKANASVRQGDLFTKTMKVGDFFYLCRGNKPVLIGKVAEEAEPVGYEGWGEDGWVGRKFTPVKESIKSESYTGEQKWWTPNDRSTCIQIPRSEIRKANDLLFRPFFQVEFVESTMELGNASGTPKSDSYQGELNVILYGPPGTGKTYYSVDKAMQIVAPGIYQKLNSNREELTKEFRSRLIKDWANTKEQIAFITFHQSLSYEDFVEGIKPLEPKDSDKSVKYSVEDGIFKKLCSLATQQNSLAGFEEAYQQFINDMMENSNLLELRTPSHKKPFNVRINSNHNVVAVPQTEAATEMVVTKDMLSLYLLEGKIKDWKPYTVSISEYIKSKFPFSIERTNNSSKPYVLIIDEINRGNVSQIFGELITLIENGKRRGQTEELTVTLPYSKKPFSVPANLYIIGTMNTADRSVEALDTALRRRFAFEEKITELKELSKDVDGIDLQQMIGKMNERLEVMLDRDHTIGHAWLMNCKDLLSLKEVFENKILPLLKEFFYNDYSKIGLVIGEAFFEEYKKYNDTLFASFKQVDKETKRELASKAIHRLRMPEGYERLKKAFQDIYLPKEEADAGTNQSI